MSSHHKVSLAFVLISVVAAPLAVAQGVGNLGSLPTQFETGTPATGWFVVDPAGTPIPVALDPTGPVWGKVFTGPQGGPFFYPAGSQPLTVTEVLLVAGTNPWTDWHEDVLDPNWTWANPMLLVNGVPAPGLTTQISGPSISFFFNPIAPGTVVQIRKELIWNGAPGTTFVGTLGIHEYPTGIPEPAALALLGLGGVFLRRR